MSNTVPTTPAIEHPPWCDPAECDAGDRPELGSGAHRSLPLLLQLGYQVFTDTTEVHVRLIQHHANWPTDVYVHVDVPGAPTAHVSVELAHARSMHRELGALLASAEGRESA